MSAVQKQIRKLYAFNALGNLSIAGAAWVLLLVSRGFTLIQVGVAETVFHLVSITAEIPSGVFADVMGRKKSLMVSCVMGILSALTMAFWTSFTGVCVSIAFSALTYNFASGTDSALAYDTLLEHRCADQYDHYVSTQTVIYRVSNGIATLAAGVAVMIGNTAAQMIGIALDIPRLGLAAGMEENAVVMENRARMKEKIAVCCQESLTFLRGNRAVAHLILRNALVGAVDVLLLFFLQAKLPMTGIADWVLGPLLFLMSMGGVLGARMSERVKDWPFTRIFLATAALACLGFLAEFTGRGS
ncbi:MAG: MFS transporter [Clostridia bacterium]|nr:MFS transporter [Clostridia bacterium]